MCVTYHISLYVVLAFFFPLLYFLFFFLFFFLMIRRPPRSTLFPTRRSSDLGAPAVLAKVRRLAARIRRGDPAPTKKADRKSTRLNSSHEWISYAVFCLKKKKKNNI